MLQKKRILVAPLNWGLGHATRCIPVIRTLIDQGAEVIIGADHLPLHLLRMEFPDLEHIEFPGLEVRYKSNTGLILNMALQANKFVKAISEEHAFLQRAVENYAIDAVISDNRYGAYSETIPSVLITHQVFINLPLGKKVMGKMIRKYISNFDECWIPDLPGKENLSGELSHKEDLPENYHFIGPQSRFATFSNGTSEEFARKLLIILSGPEPNRTELERKLLDQLDDVDYEVLLVRGVRNALKVKCLNPQVDIKSMLGTKDLYEAITTSEFIISRSGYSTVMDLAALGKSAILVPTTGQTEQEYLAERLMAEKYFYSEKEQDFQLKRALEKTSSYSGLKLKFDDSSLRRRIRQLLSYSK